MMKNCSYFLILSTLLLSCQSTKTVETFEVPKRSFDDVLVKNKSELSWTTPKGWRETPATDMRLAGFQVDAVKRGGSFTADGSIVVLDGAGGGVVPNVNRWRGQIGLGAAAASKIEAVAHRDQGALGKFQWFHLENQGEDIGILVSIIANKNQTLFVKLIGPLETLTQNREIFLKLCRSIK